MLGSIGPVGRAVELSQLLGLDRSLAWKIWRVAQGPEELPSPKHVPGRAGMAGFLEAAERRGAPAQKVAAVRDVHARLERLIKAHAGDRASADILLGGFTREGQTRLEGQLRRNAFRANCHVLGIRARTRHQMDVVAPSPAPFMPIVARVRGYYGLQRMRANARWVLSRSSARTKPDADDTYRRVALADGQPSASRASAPIVPEFCSPSGPAVERTRIDKHTAVDELGPGPIGEVGSATVVTAELVSEIPDEHEDHDSTGIQIRTPNERLCYELLIHRDIVGDTFPAMNVYTTLNATEPLARPDPRDRIPVPESLRALGATDTAPPAVEVPRHGELTAWVFERLGHTPADFLTFRFQLKFPPIPILVWVTYRVAR